jgi:hypothetical protein
MQRPFTGLVCLAVLAALRAVAPARAETTTPSPAPTLAASPTPVPPTYVRFVEADVLPGERVANAYAPHVTGRVTNRLRAAIEFKFFGPNFLEFEYRRWDAVHPTGFVTQPRTLTPIFVPAARYTQQDVLVNNSIIGRGHTYLATSTLIHSSNDSDPNLHADLGFGIERLPDPTKTASLFFAYFYYPEVTGKISVPPGVPAANLRYKCENYNVGGTLGVPNTPLFLTAGVVADHYLRKQNAASDATHFATQLGIGAHL